METARYNYIRGELIRLHNIIMNQTFVVSLPLSYFLNKRQLEHLKENPPITGFGSLEEPVRRPYTMNRLLDAFELMGSDISIGFMSPRKDIPVIYETIQDWIRYWIEIKEGAGYLRTPPVEELELIEKLARYVFGVYTHYYYEKVNATFNVAVKEEMSLLDVFKAKLMYGDEGANQDLSYVSYLDQYKSATGYVGNVDTTGASETLSNLMRGFGGGI